MEVTMNARDAVPERDLDESTGSVDWSGTLRLGFVAGLLAAFAAILFAGRFSEQTIVLTVIVAASVASWSRIDRVPRHWP
jgi:hypothetical protein